MESAAAAGLIMVDVIATIVLLSCFVIFCKSLDVKTNSTLLQTVLRADFPLPFDENEV
jgi:predicted small integral membrane protein